MGRVSKALQKAGPEFREKFRQNATESESNSNRHKTVYISLLALLTLVLIVVVYLFFQVRQKTVAFDLEELKSANTHIAELQEKLNISQSDHLSLKDEIAKSKRQIEDLQTQVANFEKEKALSKAVPMVAQKIQEPSDDLDISVRSSEEPDLTQRTKSTALSGSDAVRKDAKSTDPTAIIDWLLKKHSE